MAKGEILICTDSDCIVDNNWIENGVALISNNENTIFGGGLKPRTNPSWIERLWLLNDNGETVQQNDLMGSCIFTSRQLYLKSGKFPEDITSGEDTFFSRAAKHEGINVVLSPSLSLAHLGSPTTPVDFIKRQRWHGENYLKNPKESIKDKTFLIALCYSTSLIISFSSVVLNFWTLLFFSAATATACAGIVSAKRVKRARDMRFKLRDTFGILVLDHFYLTGRSLGILTGLIHKTMKYIAYDS